MEGLGLIVARFATAVEPLTTTARATLDVAAFHVELTLDYAAVVTRARISAPIIWLLSIANAWNLLAVDNAGGD